MDEPKLINIRQRETKRAMAVYSHLRQIFRACAREGNLLRPLLMDQGDLLLASASFRALFFDENPVLLDFLEHHQIDSQIEFLETNVLLFLLSAYVPDDVHVSDFFAEILLDENMAEAFPLNETKPTFMAFTEGAGHESAMKQMDVLFPSKDEDPLLDIAAAPASTGGPSQYLRITRRRVKLKDWGNTRIGYLKSIPITRKNLLCYVANKLGGVHYDHDRLPVDENDRQQFRVLAQAYDWEDQAIVHAGFVFVGIACLEIVKCEALTDLMFALHDFHNKRQERLMRGDRDIPSD